MEAGSPAPRSDIVPEPSPERRDSPSIRPDRPRRPLPRPAPCPSRTKTAARPSGSGSCRPIEVVPRARPSSAEDGLFVISPHPGQSRSTHPDGHLLRGPREGRLPRDGAGDARSLGSRSDRGAIPPSQRRLRHPLLLPGWTHHRKQPDGCAPRLGPDLQGSLPALPQHDREETAVSERVRLSGSLGRGRGRKGAWSQE